MWQERTFNTTGSIGCSITTAPTPQLVSLVSDFSCTISKVEDRVSFIEQFLNRLSSYLPEVPEPSKTDAITPSVVRDFELINSRLQSTLSKLERISGHIEKLA